MTSLGSVEIFCINLVLIAFVVVMSFVYDVEHNWIKHEVTLRNGHHSLND